MLSEQQQPCSQDGTLTVRNGPTVTAPCRIFPRCSSTYPSFIESLAFLASNWSFFAQNPWTKSIDSRAHNAQRTTLAAELNYLFHRP